MGNGDKVGFVIYGFVWVCLSSLVIDGCVKVSRSFGVLNLRGGAVIDPRIYFREGEVWNH